MKKVAVLRSERPGLDPWHPFLGPAEVVEVSSPLEVRVRLPDGAAATARPALAFSYAPVPGDLLLVIGNPDGHYAIGVLHGKGKATMAIPGDVEIRAVGGELSLSGDRGVRVEGERVEVRAGKLALLAEAVVETLGSLRQHVRDLWSVRAGEAHTVVDDASFQQSKTATIVTEDDVIINGRAVHLG